MHTIALANCKGGVGKTTTAINLAGALNDRGLDALLVDLDPQGNATEGLGLNSEYTSSGPTLFDVLVDGAPLDDIVVEHEEMDVVPSHLDMIAVEKELLLSKRSEERLDQALTRFAESAGQGAYDVIIIDCPPSLGVLSDSALLAADDLVIPALAESTSKRAIELLFEYQIDELHEHFERAAETRAVVASRIDTDGESEDMVAWLKDAFEPSVPVFEVRKRVAIKRAWGEGRSIYADDELCDMAEVFDDLADHLVGVDATVDTEVEA